MVSFPRISTTYLPAALTGFEMMQIMASGQCWAQAAVRVATIVALVLNRSSRVMPENDPIQSSQSTGPISKHAC